MTNAKFNKISLDIKELLKDGERSIDDITGALPDYRLQDVTGAIRFMTDRGVLEMQSGKIKLIIKN